MYISNQNKSPFIKYNELESYCTEIILKSYKISTSINWVNLKTLIDRNILPVYSSDTGEKIFLKEDINDIASLLINHSRKYITQKRIEKFFTNVNKFFVLASNTLISMIMKINNINPAYYPAIRNLIAFCRTIKNNNQISFKEIPYFNLAAVATLSKEVVNFVTRQLQRSKKVVQSKASLFAHSAYYMGSKRNLGAFLVESLFRFLPYDGFVIDLMCGSGAASQALSTIWSTYASDAQFFCQHLALIQGKGYTYKRANTILKKIIPLARKNAHILNKDVEEWIKKEEIFFHSNINQKLFENYKTFTEEVSCYPTYKSIIGKRLYKKVLNRKKNPTHVPYCLFTAYFANIYFGLRQTVEIDSIRYAIDQLETSNDKDWAIGALIATISCLGSTYAAHFAQPKKLTLKNLPGLLDQRAKSIIHEFCIRFGALARESENAKYQIRILPGPWQTTLASAEKILKKDKVLIYLDAPYKREEYSRYYHILETAVLYNYPAATKKGKLPDKEKGERFRSIFFSRNRDKIEKEISRIICSVLRNGWTCAWSYSDNGDASIINVIEQVYNVINCRVLSFSTPYQHKPQGKRKQKNVIEYLILFLPVENKNGRKDGNEEK